MNIHLLLIVAYAAVLVLLGLWIGRRVDSTSDFFVAGRRLGPVLLFATVLAANIGAGSTVGAASLGYRDGLSGWWWVGSAGIGTLALAFWLGPKIWRVAREHQLYTVGDYLELRYGQSVRATIAVLLWVATVAILAGQLIAVGVILNVVADVPRWVGCLIGGGVMTVYFAAGGLFTSAWINLVQLVVLLGGFAVAFPLALSDAGGWSAVVSAAPQESAGYFNAVHGGGSGWTYLLFLGPAFVISPGLLQKAYGARDERTIRRGLGAAALVLFVFAALPPILGMIARVHEPGLENMDLALPVVLMEGLPVVVGSLGLAAVLSAELSSADAILFMLATSLSKDLYKRFLKPAASDEQVLRVARAAAIAGGTLGVLLAVVLPTVIDALTIFYSVLVVSLFVPIVAGLYSRRAGVSEAFAAIVGGVVVWAVVRVAPGDLASWAPSVMGLAASALLFVLISLRRRPQEATTGPGRARGN